MSVVEFISRKTREVFNFTKDRVRLLVPQGIWEIFTTYISCTPAANYFYYCVMPRSFLLDTRVFSLYLYRWRHWEITSKRLFLGPLGSSRVLGPCFPVCLFNVLFFGYYSLINRNANKYCFVFISGV